MRTFIFAVACIYKDQKTRCSVRGGDLCGVSDSMFVPTSLSFQFIDKTYSQLDII